MTSSTPPRPDVEIWRRTPSGRRRWLLISTLIKLRFVRSLRRLSSPARLAAGKSDDWANSNATCTWCIVRWLALSISCTQMKNTTYHWLCTAVAWLWQFIIWPPAVFIKRRVGGLFCLLITSIYCIILVIIPGYNRRAGYCFETRRTLVGLSVSPWFCSVCLSVHHEKWSDLRQYRPRHSSFGDGSARCASHCTFSCFVSDARHSYSTDVRLSVCPSRFGILWKRFNILS